MEVIKFQEGGVVDPSMQAPAGAEGMPVSAEQAPMEEGAPQGGDPMQQLEQLAMQIAQEIGDPQLIQALAQMLMTIAEQSSASAEQPTFQRKGGKLTRI